MFFTLLLIGCLGAKSASQLSLNPAKCGAGKAKLSWGKDSVTIQDNNQLYCVVGSDSQYYPDAGTPRDTGVWCKEKGISQAAIFDQYQDGEKVYFRSRANHHFCRSVIWKRRVTGDWRYRIECDGADASKAERFTMMNGMLTDSKSKSCFSDGITGIRCRWHSTTPFTISKYPPPCD